MNRKIKTSVLILCLIVSGFIRESFFKSVNVLLKSKQGVNYFSEGSDFWNFMDAYDEIQLVRIKWMATLFFVFLFLGLGILLIYVLFGEKKYILYTIAAYAGILILSGIALGFGKLIPSIDTKAYYFARWMLGAAQSPLLPALIAIVIFYIVKQNPAKEIKE